MLAPYFAKVMDKSPAERAAFWFASHIPDTKPRAVVETEIKEFFEKALQEGDRAELQLFQHSINSAVTRALIKAGYAPERYRQFFRLPALCLISKGEVMVSEGHPGPFHPITTI